MSTCNAMSRFGNNVKTVMQSRGLTLRGLAREIGMDHSNLSKILNAKEGVTLERADKIAEALGVPLAELLSESLKICAA